MLVLGLFCMRAAPVSQNSLPGKRDFGWARGWPGICLGSCLSLPSLVSVPGFPLVVTVGTSWWVALLRRLPSFLVLQCGIGGLCLILLLGAHFELGGLVGLLSRFSVHHFGLSPDYLFWIKVGFREARKDAADAHERGDVFMYRDSSAAPLLDLRRRFKAVMDVLDSMIRDGFSLARSVELAVQWDGILRVGLLDPVAREDFRLAFVSSCFWSRCGDWVAWRQDGLGILCGCREWRARRCLRRRKQQQLHWSSLQQQHRVWGTRYKRKSRRCEIGTVLCQPRERFYDCCSLFFRYRIVWGSASGWWWVCLVWIAVCKSWLYHWWKFDWELLKCASAATAPWWCRCVFGHSGSVGVQSVSRYAVLAC